MPIKLSGQMSGYWKYLRIIEDNDIKSLKDLIKVIRDINMVCGSRTLLYSAVIYDKSEAVKILAAAGADIHLSSPNREPIFSLWTPLHYTICGKNVEMVKLLVTLGVDVNRCSDTGETPLHNTICIGNDITLCEIMINGGADRTVRRSDGHTPASLAFSLGHMNQHRYLTSTHKLL